MRAIFALVLCLLVAVAQAKGELKWDFIPLNNKAMRLASRRCNKKQSKAHGRAETSVCPSQVHSFEERITPLGPLPCAFFPIDEQRRITFYTWG